MISSDIKRKRVERNGSELLTGPSALEARFAQLQSQLSRKRKRLVRSILDDPCETVFLTTSGLAERFKVNTATVVRTVQAMGYHKFAEFAADLRQHFLSWVAPYTTLKKESQQKRTPPNVVRHCMDRAMENLSSLATQADSKAIFKLARLIHKSRRIMLVGDDTAFCLSLYLTFGLVAMGCNAEAPGADAWALFLKTSALGPKDLLIAFSFGPCSRNTMEVVFQAKNQGVRTFGITDQHISPIARHCDGYLIAPAGGSFLPSWVAAMALLDAVVEVSALTAGKKSLALLQRAEVESKSGTRWYQERRVPGSRGQ